MDAKVELKGGYFTVHKEACCSRQVRAELHQRLPSGPYLFIYLRLYTFLPRPNFPESNAHNVNSFIDEFNYINIT